MAVSEAPRPDRQALGRLMYDLADLTAMDAIVPGEQLAHMYKENLRPTENGDTDIVMRWGSPPIHSAARLGPPTTRPHSSSLPVPPAWPLGVDQDVAIADTCSCPSLADSDWHPSDSDDCSEAGDTYAYLAETHHHNDARDDGGWGVGTFAHGLFLRSEGVY